jgi:malonyl CoA-acyl carrier protein transacylase
VSRVAILCPGRGSYTERTLRSLPEDHPWVRHAEELRAARGLGSLLELDRAERFQPARHLRPAEASPLIWLVALLDAARAMDEHEAVCVLGNSMGWYTALAVAGALDFEDGFRLVQELALLQEEHAAKEGGGQLLFPLVDEDWRPSTERAADVERALDAGAGEAFWSIRLGGYAVLAGSEDGLKALARSLPKVKLGANAYPLRLVQHGPYHTPLCASVAVRAGELLGDLAFRRPRVTLIDGRGARHTPWGADAEELRRYTLGAQVTTPYDLTLSVRVALREHAPELVACPGPGNSLGGVTGQIALAEGWRGLASRADFEALQASEHPLVWSLRR